MFSFCESSNNWSRLFRGAVRPMSFVCSGLSWLPSSQIAACMHIGFTVYPDHKIQPAPTLSYSISKSGARWIPMFAIGPIIDGGLITRSCIYLSAREIIASNVDVNLLIFKVCVFVLFYFHPVFSLCTSDYLPPQSSLVFFCIPSSISALLSLSLSPQS